MTRSQKRINIILFYVLLVIAFGGVIYFMTKPEMTCNDGVKNQGEEKVDCGGPCNPCLKKKQFKALEVKSIERVDDRQGGEDLLIKIYNPNKEYGAKLFTYRIYDNGKSGAMYNYKDTDFIMPNELKSIIINKYKTKNRNVNINIIIDNDNIQWGKIDNFRNSNLVIYNDRYVVQSTGGNYAELSGVLVNESAVDYKVIKVKGVLRDKNGNLLAASYQIINTLPAGGQREFHIIFPVKFLEQVATKNIQVETNILDSENYLKIKGKQDKWDQ